MAEVVLIPATVIAADSMSVLSAEFVWSTKVNASGVESGAGDMVKLIL